MADTKKKNKDDYKICLCCGKERKYNTNNFYQNISPYINDKMAVCKKCIKDVIRYDDMESIFFILHILNKPFIKEKWDECLNSDKDTWGEYIKQMSSLPQYKDLTWNNTNYMDLYDSEIIKNTQVQAINNNQRINVEKVKQWEMFWGKGFDIDDYEYLEMEFHEWATRYKCDEYAEEVLYKEICLQTLAIRKDREKGADVTKKVETLQKLMGSANVKPADTNAINSADNVNALGLWIRDIEKFRPAEYFKDKKIYVDFDKFKEYMDRFIFRPLKNLLMGTREFDSEFNIEDETIHQIGEDNEQL